MSSALPAWITYPAEEWLTITPSEAGLDARRFEAWLRTLGFHGADFGGEDHTANKWGVMLTRGGYCVKTWGDPHYRFPNRLHGQGVHVGAAGLCG